MSEEALRRQLDLGGPLSPVLIPLVLGLRRKMLLRAGAVSVERRLAGIRTHWYYVPGRSGSDPELPLVLIHGIADSALTWAFTMRGLARIGPVYALDLPGFGLSGFPPGRRYTTIAEHTQVIAALLREEIGHPALLVGNSMGGWISLRLAQTQPALVRGLVLLDPGGALLNGRDSWQPFVEVVTAPDLGAVRRIYRQMYGRVPLPLYFSQRAFQSLFLRDPVQQFVALASEDDFFTAEELRQISVPVGLVWGDRDRFLPDGSFEFFRDNLPGADVLVLRRCGHLPQYERPRAVVRFVRRFARRLRAPAQAPPAGRGATRFSLFSYQPSMRLRRTTPE